MVLSKASVRSLANTIILGAVIALLNPALQILVRQDLNVKVMQLQQVDVSSINIVNAYFKFTMPTNEPIEKLNAITRATKLPFLITVAVNAHSTRWNS